MTITTEQTLAKVVRLDAGALNEAKAVLCRAYKNEPAFRYLLKHDRPGYQQRVRAAIRELLNLHFSNDQDLIGLTLDNHLIAVAVLEQPGAHFSFVKLINWGMRMMLTVGIVCTWRYMNYYKQVSKQFPDAPHHTLPLLGVDTKFLNMGYGRQLMLAVENICNENPVSMGIGLNTGNTRYLSFYQNLGYQLIGQVQLSGVNENVLLKSDA